MNNIKSMCLLVVAFIATSCSTSIKTTLSDKSLTALASAERVIVIGQDEPAPTARKLGKVKVGDSGFTTDCGYNTVVDQAKTEARKAGGNAIKITKLKKPSVLGSTCYRIEADILLIANAADYVGKSQQIQDSITRTKFPANPDYALMYIYRPSSGSGFLLNYTVKLNGQPIAKVKNNSKEVVKIYTQGLQKVSASIETEEVKEIEIKFGEEYFLECGINTGIVVGRPEMNFVDKEVGRAQFERIKD